MEFLDNKWSKDFKKSIYKIHKANKKKVLCSFNTENLLLSILSLEKYLNALTTKK